MDIINAGTNPDGSPHLLYHAPGEHVVITPQDVSGTVTLPNGDVVDVSDRVIVVTSQEEGAEVVAAIAQEHQGATPEEAQAIVSDLTAPTAPTEEV